MIVSLLPLRGRAKLEVEGLFRLKNEPGPGMCVVTGCRKKHVPEKHGGKLHLCPKHRQERWRRLNPKQAAFATLRDHARGRKIPFTLTLQTFLRVTEAAGYWDQSPECHGDRLSVDRIDIDGPYSDDNVRIITVSENVAAGNRDRTRFLSPEVREILARRRGVPETAWQMAEGKHWLDDESEPF